MSPQGPSELSVALPCLGPEPGKGHPSQPLTKGTRSAMPGDTNKAIAKSEWAALSS